jgi:hypothetical protein
MAAMHKEPSKDEIPPLCKETFISTKSGLAILWVLAGILIAMSSTAVVYAFTTDKAIIEVKSVQNALQDQINAKLDFLIKQKEQ